MNRKDVVGLFEAYQSICSDQQDINEKQEYDSFGRKKHGGVPAPGSSFDRYIKANQKALDKLDADKKKKVNEDLEEAKVDSGLTADQKSDARDDRHGLTTVHRELFKNSDRGEKKVKGSKWRDFNNSGKYSKLQNDKKQDKIQSELENKWKKRENSTYNNLAEELDIYDVVIDYLLEEGYCDNQQDAEVIMTNMSEEWLEGILDERNKFEREMEKKAGIPYSRTEVERNRNHRYKTYGKTPSPIEDPKHHQSTTEIRGRVHKLVHNTSKKDYHKDEHGHTQKYGDYTSVNFTNKYHKDNDDLRIPAEEKNKKNYLLKLKDKRKNAVNEEVDIYDLILEYLLDEGYCDDQESAEVVMVNMSEEWVDDIMEEKKLGKKHFRNLGLKAAKHEIDHPEEPNPYSEKAEKQLAKLKKS